MPEGFKLDRVRFCIDVRKASGFLSLFPMDKYEQLWQKKQQLPMVSWVLWW